MGEAPVAESRPQTGGRLQASVSLAAKKSIGRDSYPGSPADRTPKPKTR